MQVGAYPPMFKERHFLADHLNSEIFYYPTRYYSTTRLLSSHSLPNPKVKSHYPSWPVSGMVQVCTIYLYHLPHWSVTRKWLQHSADHIIRACERYHEMGAHIYTLGVSSELAPLCNRIKRSVAWYRCVLYIWPSLVWLTIGGLWVLRSFWLGGAPIAPPCVWYKAELAPV